LLIIGMYTSNSFPVSTRFCNLFFKSNSDAVCEEVSYKWLRPTFDCPVLFPNQVQKPIRNSHDAKWVRSPTFFVSLLLLHYSSPHGLYQEIPTWLTDKSSSSLNLIKIRNNLWNTESYSTVLRCRKIKIYLSLYRW